MSTNNLEDEKETVSNSIPCKLTIFNYKFLKSTDYYIYIYTFYKSSNHINI